MTRMPMGNLKYHLVAFVTVAIWGSTFVFTKMLLQSGLTPAQIFTLRFAIAYVLLLGFSILRDKVSSSPPKLGGVRGGLKTGSFRLFSLSWRDELLMVLLGVTGGSVYFLAENAAMLFTTATNTSLIVCSCPLFAMLLFAIVYRHSEHISKLQALGSIVACMGMAIVVLNGHFVLHLSPLGDMLAFAACLCWAVYSLLIKAAFERGHSDARIDSAEREQSRPKIKAAFERGHSDARISSAEREQSRPKVKSAAERYSSLFITRKVFFYGLLTIIPYYIFRPSEATIFSFSIFNFQLSIILNLLFLGVIASMVCYLLWNWVIAKLGAVVATNWVYFNPITTICFAWWLLDEKITIWFLLGSALILIGMYLADKKQ